MKVMIAVIVIILLAGLAGLIYIYSGFYNVAATQQHTGFTRWVLNTAKRNSVAVRAAQLDVPELGGQQRLYTGINHYDAMCSHCHTPPGASKTAVAKGLYPQPPNLAEAAREMKPEQLFWVIKHGVKMTGMPAWGPTHSDQDLWSVVAFIEHLPDMTGPDYQRLKTAAQGKGGHHQEHASGHDEAADTMDYPRDNVEHHAGTAHTH